MKPGDLIWVDHFGKHPAVVIDVHADGHLLVVCGTSTHRPHDPSIITVKRTDPTGYALELTNLTYFYESKTAVVDSRKVDRKCKQRCPPNVFHALEELARSAAVKGLVPVQSSKVDGILVAESDATTQSPVS